MSQSDYRERYLVAQCLFKQIGFKSKETSRSTNKIGYTNPNRQACLGTREQEGTDHNAIAFAMFCLDCGKVYGANGTDVSLRLCPNKDCQNGNGEDIAF